MAGLGCTRAWFPSDVEQHPSGGDVFAYPSNVINKFYRSCSMTLDSICQLALLFALVRKLLRFSASAFPKVVKPLVLHVELRFRSPVLQEKCLPAEHEFLKNSERTKGVSN